MEDRRADSSAKSDKMNLHHWMGGLHLHGSSFAALFIEMCFVWQILAMSLGPGTIY